MATALRLLRTCTEQNLQQHVPRRALLFPNMLQQLQMPPRHSIVPILLPYRMVQTLLLLETAHMLVQTCTLQMLTHSICVNYSQVSVKFSFENCKIMAWQQAGHIFHGSFTSNRLKDQQMFCINLSHPWLRNQVFLKLYLGAVRSPHSISATFLSYGRTDTSKDEQHLSIAAYDTINRAPQRWCLDHLVPSYALPEFTRVCDGACSGFQCMRNNANDIICFACISVWCLENKHLGFASVFIFNKYLSFASTIISSQQTIIQQQHIIPLTLPFKIYPLCTTERSCLWEMSGAHVFLELKLNHLGYFLILLVFVFLFLVLQNTCSL